MYGIKRFICAAAAVLLTAALPPITALAQADSIQIAQIRQDQEHAYVYMNFLDQEGEPVRERPKPGTLTVQIGDSEEISPMSVFETEQDEDPVLWAFCLDDSSAVPADVLKQEKAAAKELIRQMKETDQGIVVSLGSDVSVSKKQIMEKGSLEEKVEELEETDRLPHLFGRLQETMKTIRQAEPGHTVRAAVVVFTSGKEISEKEDSARYLTVNRYPVYVIGLQELCSEVEENGSLPDEIKRVARQSGGRVINAQADDEETILACIEKIKNTVSAQYTLKVLPPEASYGLNNPGWTVFCTDSAKNRLKSQEYIYQLQEQATTPDVQTETEVHRSGSVVNEIQKPESETQRSFSDNLAVDDEEKPGSVNTIVVWIAAGVCAILVFLLILLLVLRKRAERKNKEEGLPEIIRTPQKKQTVEPVVFKDADHARTEKQKEQKLLTLHIAFGGRTEDRNILIGEKVVLGRGSLCDQDVVLGINNEDAKKTSRKHAELFCKNGRLYIRDAGAVNRTCVNGKEIVDEVPLYSGDTIKLGNAMVTIQNIPARGANKEGL